MKGFYIEITNNLLDPKHRKKMGSAIWEFMWCLDKITKIDEEQAGWILGGKPIQLKEIKKELGITEPKISKNLHKLQKEGYISIKRTPTGLVIKVWKTKKRFAQKVKTHVPKGKALPYRQDNRQYRKKFKNLKSFFMPGMGKIKHF